METVCFCGCYDFGWGGRGVISGRGGYEVCAGVCAGGGVRGILGGVLGGRVGWFGSFYNGRGGERCR